MSASLDEWADRLQEQPLPALSLTIQRITRLMGRPSTTNANYQRVISSDPGFTLSIFRRFVDTGLTPREPVTTPAHGIALLGQAPVIDGIHLPRLKRPAPGGNAQGIYRCYAQAAPPKRGERLESTAATVPSTQAQLAAGNPESPPEEGAIIDNLPPIDNSPPPEQQPPAAGLGTIRRADATLPKSKDLALQQSISLTMRGLRDSASMDRAMFAMLTPDRKTLRARFVIGADKRAAIRHFQLNVEQRHLFSLLLTKPQEFWLNSGNQEKYLPLIPRSLHTTLDTRGFFVTSVFVRNRPLGILYGDCSDASTLDQHAFARFKQITRQLCDQLGGQKREGSGQKTALAQP